jgi:hypothetical protein
MAGSTRNANRVRTISVSTLRLPSRYHVRTGGKIRKFNPDNFTSRHPRFLSVLTYSSVGCPSNPRSGRDSETDTPGCFHAIFCGSHASQAVFRIRGDFLAMIICSPVPLAFGRKANLLVRVEWRWNKLCRHSMGRAYRYPCSQRLRW